MESTSSIAFLLAGMSVVISPWIILSITSTLGDAAVGFIDEWLLKRIKQTQTVDTEVIDAPGRLVLISGFFGALVAAIALLFLFVTGQMALLAVPNESWKFALGAGILEVVWLIPYFYALHRGGAINATPLFQTVPIFSLLLGLLFFGEIPALIHIGAAFLIILGASILNYSPSEERIDMRTIAMMLFASLVISLGYFFFKDAAEIGNFASAVIGNGIGMTVVSSFIWLVWSPYRRQFTAFIRSFDWKVLLLQFSNEGLYTLSSVANQVAIVLAPSVMIVAAFDALHPMFTLLIGWGLAKLGSQVHDEALRDRQLHWKLIAVVLISIGAAMIIL